MVFIQGRVLSPPMPPPPMPPPPPKPLGPNPNKYKYKVGDVLTFADDIWEQISAIVHDPDRVYGIINYDYVFIQKLNEDTPSTYDGLFIRMYPFYVHKMPGIKESYLKIVEKSYLNKLLGESYKYKYQNKFDIYELLNELSTIFHDPEKIKAAVEADPEKRKLALKAKMLGGRTRRSKTKRTRSKHTRHIR